MCDEAIHDCLAALKFISVWFVASKMLHKIDKALLPDEDIIFFNEDFHKVTNQRHILVVDLDKINLENNNNFHEYNPDTIIDVRRLAQHSKFEERKALKKDK